MSVNINVYYWEINYEFLFMMEDEEVLWTYFLFLQKHHLKLTLADHLLVVQTASVERQTIMLCVLASKAM